jgi:RES domain-containing protein
LIAYRITRTKFATDLSGAGGLHAAGRCNAKGTPVIYAAEHVSLALAEVLAHVDPYDIPSDYVVVTLEIPDTVPLQRCSPAEALRLSAKPPVPVFVVPSVIVPQENNVVLFPRVTGFKVSIQKVEHFSIDRRLTRRRVLPPAPELQGAIDRIVARLPPIERRFLSLYYNEGLTLGEVAIIMNITEKDANTIHVTLLEWLADLLSK